MTFFMCLLNPRGYVSKSLLRLQPIEPVSIRWIDNQYFIFADALNAGCHVAPVRRSDAIGVLLQRVSSSGSWPRNDYGVSRRSFNGEGRRAWQRQNTEQVC